MAYVTGKQELLVLSSLLFQHSKPSEKLMVSVIVPVKNEAENLHKTLDALRLQVDGNGNTLDSGIYEVLLLANNCSDQSFSIANHYRQLYPHFSLHVAEIKLPKAVANIGTARCLLMDAACKRLLAVNNDKGIIASTDGDSEVDPEWVLNIIREINKGNDAVGGRIITKHFTTSACKYYVQNERYRNLVAQAESIADPLEHDPWPRHFQYFGANLAVTCKMYEKVGGLPQLPWLEDEAFYNALVRTDAKIRKSVNVKVTTSHRQEGRVAIGFSQQLREWASMQVANKPQLVTSAEELITKFTCRQKLRTCWASHHKSGEYDQQALNSVASKLNLSEHWLHQQLINNYYFGKLWQDVESNMCSGEWGKKWKPVSITSAIKRLKLYTSDNMMCEASTICN